MTRFFPFRAFCVIILLAPSVMVASTNPERTQFGRDIRVEAKENVGDVTCIGCSIHVRGHVSGDVTAIAGSIFAEQGAAIAGVAKKGPGDDKAS